MSTIKNAVTETGSSNRKWLVAFAVFCIAMAGMGIENGCQSLFTVSICDAIGCARSAYALYSTIARVVGAVLSVVFIIIYKKIKAKGIVALAGITAVGHFLCMAYATDLTLIYVGGVCNGFSYTLTSQLLVFSIIPPWFEKGQGKVTGFISLAASVAAIIWSQVARGALQASGYQYALLISCAGMAVLTIIALIFVKTSPTDPVAGTLALSGANPLEKQAKKESTLQTYKKLLKNPVVWGACIMMFFISGIMNPYHQILAPVATEKFGAEAGVAIAALGNSLIYAGLIPGKFGFGAMKDKWGATSPMICCYILIIASSLIIASTNNEILYYIATFLYGAGGSISQLVCVYILMDIFGKYYTAAYLGITTAFFQLARAVFTPVMQLPYDIWGSYAVTSWFVVGLSILLFLYTFFMLKIGKKWQKKQDTLQITADSEAAKA